MSVLNQYACASAGSNTGIPDCAVTPKNFVGGFLVPNSFVLTDSQLATSSSALAALQAAASADNQGSRIYPLPPFLSVTDSTAQPITETIGGTPFIVRDGKYDFEMRYIKGGLCVSNALQKFNNGNYRIMLFDASGLLVGTKVGTGLMGIPLNYFYARPFRIATDTTLANFSFSIVFDSIYFNVGLGFISLNPSDLAGVAGLINASLSLVGARAANVFTVKVLAGCSGSDLYPSYSTGLANIANWLVTEGGKTITITSVVADPNSKGFIFTLDITDPDYSPTGPFLVSGSTLTALTTNGVLGYELQPLTVA